MHAAATSDEIAFDVRAISKTFGDRKALDRGDLTIGAGDMVALIGPSGSGTSTLLRVLTGLTPIDAGAGRIETFGATIQADGRVAATCGGCAPRSASSSSSSISCRVSVSTPTP